MDDFKITMRIARTMAGLTMNEVSEKMGMNRATYAKYEENPEK